MTPQKIFLDNRSTYERLEECLAEIWGKVSGKFEISGDLPEEGILYENVNLEDTNLASMQILSNMLTEAIEQVSRFSYWYTKPARAFGMISTFYQNENRYKWILAPEAIVEWQPQLSYLQKMVDKNLGIIRAMMLIATISKSESQPNKKVVAACQCNPPRTVKMCSSVFQNCEIICKDCGTEFGFY
jgi:hypothetical protein